MLKSLSYKLNLFHNLLRIMDVFDNMNFKADSGLTRPATIPRNQTGISPTFDNMKSCPQDIGPKVQKFSKKFSRVDFYFQFRVVRNLEKIINLHKMQD